MHLCEIVFYSRFKLSLSMMIFKAIGSSDSLPVLISLFCWLFSLFLFGDGFSKQLGERTCRLDTKSLKRNAWNFLYLALVISVFRGTLSSNVEAYLGLPRAKFTQLVQRVRRPSWPSRLGAYKFEKKSTFISGYSTRYFPRYNCSQALIFRDK